jgi:hypothetical protein
MDSSDAVALVSIIAALTVLWVVPIVITAMKGKQGMVLAGVFFHPCWWVGAIRLAKPDSYWARRFYDDDKLYRAHDRFPAPDPIFGSRHHRPAYAKQPDPATDPTIEPT